MPDPMQLTHLLRRALDWHQAGELARAEQGYRQILAQQPDHADALHFSGLVEHQLGRHEQAVQLMRRAIEANPAPAHYHANLGEVYRSLKEYRLAENAYREALTRDPRQIEAAGNLGLLLQESGNKPEAQQCYEQVIQLNPGSVPALVNLSTLALDDNRPEQAAQYLQQALAYAPDDPDLLSNLALAYRGIGRIDVARTILESVLASHPAHLGAHNILGGLLLYVGDSAQAVSHLQFVSRHDPENEHARRRLMHAKLYLSEPAAARRFEEAIFPSTHPAAVNFDDHARWQPDKRLRIAYVSSDFRAHSVAFNLKPIISHHDHANVEIFCYANVKRADETTEWFKSHVNSWRSILGMTDEAAARLIRDDKIDILVLLAGQFDENRPFIANYRAAPVQVSFYDAGTSGLREMDYLIADPNLVPKTTLERFTERVVRLPTYYIHAPLLDIPKVSSLPANKKGYLTFGSFNNPAKLNEQVVALWAEVLKAVPDSKLMLKYKAVFGVPEIKERYLKLFQEKGIPAERLALVGELESRSQHLGRYAEIDVVLDPFPFTGATATFEALWMGVPVLTLMGDWFMARWSGAMLKKLKLDELIAYNPAEYVEIAKRLASDLENLARLRASLRERVKRSPLCNEKKHTHQLERLFRWMWRKRCATAGRQ